MRKWVTAVAVGVALAGVGGLVYWQWDPIWEFVFSPVGGIFAKILLTGKALKAVLVVAFAVGAGVLAVRRKLRRGAPEPEVRYAPPVFGPPEENALTSTGTGTATTTGSTTAPPSRPI
jgi:hypothetical protein